MIKFAKGWIVVYAVGLTLVPPLMFHGKSYYAAEWMLLPLIVLLIPNLKRIRPSSALTIVWLSLLVSFIAGYFRGELAKPLSLYPMPDGDAFSLPRDAIRFLRWSFIFSVPWIVKETLGSLIKESEEDLVELFTAALSWTVTVSAILALLDWFGAIDLVKMGYHSPSPDWTGRSFGTFSSPLEASLVYGAFFVLKINHLSFEWPDFGRRHLLDAVVILATGAALLLTKGGTAMTATLICLVYIIFPPPWSLKKGLWMAVALLGAFVLFYLMSSKISPHFISQKISNFDYRFGTWKRWIATLPGRPLFFLIGMGFTSLIVDNSFFYLLIVGGVFLVGSLAGWCVELWKRIPTRMIVFFLFWVISWLTLDSIGYWGIGRIAWCYLGLFGLTSDASPDESTSD